MTYRSGAAGLALAALMPAAAAAATPFTTGDYYLLAAVSEPAFSPSGATVVYVVSRNHEKDDESESDLWSVPWSGGAPRQLTKTRDASESQPRFGRDGKSIYYLSDAGDDEETQLWRMSANGGGARQVTRIPGG